MHVQWNKCCQVKRFLLGNTGDYRYTGLINTLGFFMQLLCGIAYTGIAPDT